MSTNKEAAVSTLSQLALQIAISQLGQSEQPKGSNKGPMVTQYQASVGLAAGGYAWCQAFVHWCYEQAAKQMGLTNPVVHTAGVLDCWNRTAVNFKLTAIQNPSIIKPGDQFILSYGGGAGHTGIIESIEGDLLHTIEGNSNTNGSREGYEVVRHYRKLTDGVFKGIIQY